MMTFEAITLHQKRIKATAAALDRDRRADACADMAKLAFELDAFIDRHASAIQRDQSDAETLAAAEAFRSEWFGSGFGASVRDQLAEFASKAKGFA